MSPENKILFSSLVTKENLEVFLHDLGYSKTKIKEYIPKKILQKPVEKKMQLELPIDLVNQWLINPHYDGGEVDVIFEDENFLVINKPMFVHSHPLKYSDTNNCLSFLTAKKVKLENTKSYDRTLLHRLDYETSGVLMLAKKEKDYLLLRDDFKNLCKKKNYFAIVMGKFDKEGLQEHHLESSSHKGHLMRVKEKGNLAQAHFSLKEYNKEKDVSLVKIELITGLRHQIRVQLSELGFPILGDVLYGGDEAERLFLHSYQYELEWQNKKYVFCAKKMELFDIFFNLNSSL